MSCELSILNAVTCEVALLKPGECLNVSYEILAQIGDVGGYLLGSMKLSPVDRIMRGIIGSSFNTVIIPDAGGPFTTFQRLEKPLDGVDGRRTYVEPDRREYYRQDGVFWHRNYVEYVPRGDIA